MVEKKYLLKGLSCANCASKIESKVKNLSFVKEATVNFMTKELKVKIDNLKNLDELNHSIHQIVSETEDGVDICELPIREQKMTVCQIEGLHCANCAAKIEKKLNETEGITSAHLDFVGNKLKLTLNDKTDKKIMLEKAQTLIDQIEPGVKINEMIDTRHPHHEHSHDEEANGWELIRLVLGTLIFISIIFVSKTSVYYLPLFVLSYLLIGGEVLVRAIKNSLRGNIFDENFLMTIATLAAFAIKEYPEAVAVMLFYQVGERFQDLAVNRSRRSIKNLMSIRPDYANLKIGKEIIEVTLDEVNVDDIIIVKAGERVPLDGVIMEGSSSLDTKALTGESLPLSVSAGDKVISGCININGLLTVRVTKNASESTVAKVLELVENATSKKAPTEKFITKFARVYTPIVTISAFLLAIIPPLLFGGEFTDWLKRASIFLVISCPCALVISIPLGFFSGIGLASKNGVLIKGGNFLEALNQIELAVFDKTGTLTEGSFVVTKIESKMISNEVFLEKTAYIESFSNHPIAKSVLAAYNQDVNQSIVSNVQEKSGLGLIGNIHEEEIMVGNARLLKSENISFDEVDEVGSILYVAINKEYAGYLVVSDQIKKDAKEALKMLKALGVKKTVMLSGDKIQVAKTVGDELGLDEVYGELLPQDKLSKVETFINQKSKTGKLVFVGDGINDTPVLARADIGIAMGGLGADAAIDVADVVIMTDEPSKIVTAIKVAKVTRRIVWQNIFFALGVKALFLLLGAFGIATMWEAVFADVGVSLIAILNSMRILRAKIN